MRRGTRIASPASSWRILPRRGRAHGGLRPVPGLAALRLARDRAEQRVRRTAGQLLARCAPARLGPDVAHRGRVGQYTAGAPAMITGRASDLLFPWGERWDSNPRHPGPQQRTGRYSPAASWYLPW